MRGSIRQRSKGTWQLRYEAPTDLQGNRGQISETVRGTRKEAERALRDRLSQIENGGFVTKSKETVEGFLDRWLESYAAIHTEPSTLQGYRAHTRLYVNPHLGTVQLQALRPAHIHSLHAHLLDRGLSPKTIRLTHAMFREALKHAVEWGELMNNPAVAAKPPPLERREVKAWDTATFNTFLIAADQSPFRDAYHLIILTGLRRSELCGLMWNEVDLDAGELAVRRKLLRVTGRGLVEGKPKTQRGRRKIALGDEATTVLRRVRGQQAERRLQTGSAWQGRGHVFTDEMGNPIDPERITRSFRRLVQEHDLPHLTPHGLRHTWVSILSAAGVPIDVISKQAGHASVAFTLDIYSHMIDSVERKAADAVDEAMRRSRVASDR